MRRALLLLAACFPAACTFEPGNWFATLHPSLTAAYAARPDRDAGQGWQRLSNDYEVRIARATLALGGIHLLAGTGSGAMRFNPAKPPPGYSLCHNGHCHSADGRLVPYAEIEAELGGGGMGLQQVVALPVEGELDLLAPAERALACQPSCHLDRLRILRASAPLRRLALEGTVRDRRMPARLGGEWTFRFDLRAGADGGAPAPSLEAELDLPADRRHPPAVTLRLRAELTAALLDGVELAGPTGPDGVVNLAAAPERAARVLANLGEQTFLTAVISR